MRHRFLAISAACSLLVWTASGCSGGSGHHADPTTTTTSPYAVPPVITAAYVDSVFAALNHVQGDATRALMSARAVTPGLQVDLRAIFNDPLYAEEVKIYGEELQAGLDHFRQVPGDIRTTVRDLVHASSTCVFVETVSDADEVNLKPIQPPASEYWMLQPKQPGADPDHLNPTGWSLSFNADYDAPTSVPDQCPAR